MMIDFVMIEDLAVNSTLRHDHHENFKLRHDGS